MLISLFAIGLGAALGAWLRGQYAWGIGIIAAHLGGSLLMTVMGIQTFKWLQGAQ